MLVDSVLDAIGNVPMVRVQMADGTSIFAKAELLNPGGSIKDRVAKHMLLEAQKEGLLKADSIIVEPSSGNTGIGMTLIGVQLGYRVIIVMPENMSEERKKIIRALGGELELTPCESSLEGAVKRAEEMVAADSRMYMPQQFENPRNPEAHYLTTGPEIWEDMQHRIDAFVAGVGSGGTLQGVGKFLQEQDPKIRLVAVEPANAAALLGHEPGLHQIQGIGDGFVPAVLDTEMIDQIVTVTDEAAIETTRALAREQGLLAGTSSGANVWASLQVAKELPPGARIVTVLPDRAERYFSTALI